MGLEPIGVNEDDVVLKGELPAGVSDPSQLAASSDIPTSAWEVNAMSDSYSAPVQSVNGQSGNVEIDSGMSWDMVSLSSTGDVTFSDPVIPIMFAIYSDDDSWGSGSIDATIHFENGQTVNIGFGSHQEGWRKVSLWDMAMEHSISAGERVVEYEVNGSTTESFLVYME